MYVIFKSIGYVSVIKRWVIPVKNNRLLEDKKAHFHTS